jgi:hypothetical protein
MISGTCKQSSAERHTGLLKVNLEACQKKLEQINSKVYCLALDGESKRGRALANLTLHRSLSYESPLFQMLGHLSLFNMYVGDNDLTMDKDYKHIFK